MRSASAGERSAWRSASIGSGDVVGEVGELAAGVGERVAAGRLPDLAVHGVEQRGEPRLVLELGVALGEGDEVEHRRHGEQVDVRPARGASRWARLRSISAAALCCRSSLVITHTSAGSACRAATRKASSGAVSSWVQSVTNSDAVGRLEAGQVERADRRVEPADAGHVDDVQAGRQQPAGER